MDEGQADPKCVEAKARAQSVKNVTDLVDDNRGEGDCECQEPKGSELGDRPGGWKQFRKSLGVSAEATGRKSDPRTQRLLRKGSPSRSRQADVYASPVPPMAEAVPPVKYRRRARGRRGGAHGVVIHFTCADTETDVPRSEYILTVHSPYLSSRLRYSNARPRDSRAVVAAFGLMLKVEIPILVAPSL